MATVEKRGNNYRITHYAPYSIEIIINRLTNLA